MVLTRAQKKQNQIKSIDKKNLISATKISNSIKNDKLLDYLNILNSNGMKVSEDLSIVKKRSFSFDEDSDSFDEYSNNLNKTANSNNFKKKRKSSFDYIMEGGYLFEFDIIQKIKQMMEESKQNDKLIDIGELNDIANADKTIQIIKNNCHQIILGSVVFNSTNNTWGKPDLIVKGEWICNYIKENIYGLDNNKWYIIDIKSSTIQLINGGIDISSKPLYSVYKSQIYIYTQALNQSLSEIGISNNVEIGFILGKKYKYIEKKNQVIKNSFDSLGIIDFKKEISKGINWDKIISSSIEWLDDLKTNWKNFTLNPINRDELYPNMKNSYCKNWNGVKKNIAVKNKELSLMWYCGLSNREKAWAHGIKSYMDPNLTPEILGFDKLDSKYKIINQMLKLLHIKNKKYILDKKNNLMNWQTKAKWEFFIDFETYNDDILFDEANEWDNIYTSNQKIYMCGISWFDTNTTHLIHKSFVIKYSNSQNLKEEFEKFEKFAKFDNDFGSEEEEKIQVNWNNYVECVNELDLMKKIVDFVNSFKPKSMDKMEYFNNTRLIHWSGAEPILFNKKIAEYQVDLDEYKLNWYDLLKVFKHPEYPIIIKECFGFGLKSIVKKLNELKEINIYWSELDDGLLSSFIARDIYYSKSKEPDKQMYEIVKYNWIDCKAMWVLIQWMRNRVSKK